jgi:hypothetical protein
MESLVDKHFSDVFYPSTGPVRVSSVDDFSTQDTYLGQIYLLLHIIESKIVNMLLIKWKKNLSKRCFIGNAYVWICHRENQDI